MNNDGKGAPNEPERLLNALATGEASQRQIEALCELLAEETEASRELARRVRTTLMTREWFRAVGDGRFARETADLIARLRRDSGKAFVLATMQRVQASADASAKAAKAPRAGAASRRASRHLRAARRRARIFPYVVVAVASAACVLVAFHLGLFQLPGTDSVAKDDQRNPVEPKPPESVVKNGQPEPVNPRSPVDVAVAKNSQPKPVEPESPEVEVMAAIDARRGDGQPLKSGDHARAGDTIITGAAGSVSLRYADETSLELRARGELVMLPGEASADAKERSKSIELRAGGLAAKVAPQAKGQPLAIRTAQATTTVVGTQFSLQVKDSRTCLQVTEGTVQFERGNERLLVAKDTIAVADERRPGFSVFRLDGNLALMKPTSTSTSQFRRNGERAVDGKLDNAWMGPPTPQWLQVDLGEPCKVAAIQIFTFYSSSDGRYFQYAVELSKDGKEWHKVVDQSANTTPSTAEGDLYLLSEVEEARFVRFNMLKSSVDRGVLLNELRVFPP